MKNLNVALFGGACAAVLAGFAPVAGHADEGAAATIVVVASGIEQDIDTVGKSVTVIDREEIEQRQTVSVADLLATTPGLSVARNGGFGGITSLFVRGAESDQVLVLIDGVRVNDQSAPTGAYDFGGLQTGSVERIEVLRGANSVIWGSQALGGVVNIVTADAPAEGVKLSANAEYGDHKTGQAGATVGYGAGPLRASLSGAWFSTAGISATTSNDERDKNDQYQLNGRIDVALSEAVGIDLRGFHSRSFVELDGFNPSGTTRQSNGYAGLRAGLLDGALNLRGGYSLSDTRRFNTSAFGDSRFTGRSERVEVRGDWRAIDSVRLVFGAESEWSEANNSFLAAPQRSRISSGYAQLSVEPLTGLTLSGGVRHDDHRSFGGETTFAADAAYRLGGTRIRASYAEGFKAPALDQLFASYGNPGLTPERSRNIDMGVEHSFLGRRVTVGVTYFDRHTDDQIVFFGCSTNPNPLCAGRGQFGSYYLNVRQTTADGAEAELTIRPTDSLRLTANYSFINARSRSAPNIGNELPRRPRQLLNGSIDWTGGRFSLGATVRVASDSYDNLVNTVRLDGYAVADVRASIAITDQVEIYGRVENLFDQDYQTVANFRTLGRSAYGGLRVRL